MEKSGEAVSKARDGRIDNRADLAAALNIDASVLSQTADSALFMVAFLSWGERCVDQLVGEFAAVIWDRDKNQLHCICDHFALRPLVYHTNSDVFAVSSMPKGLHALPWVARRLNQAKFADYLVLNFGEGEETFFEGIRRLTWAQSLTVSAQKDIQTRRYWNARDVPDLRYKDDHDYVLAFKERFELAIAAHLRSTGQVGAFLSGGLDSSAVSATAAGILERSSVRLPTFSSVPEAGLKRPELPGHYADETPYVRLIGEAVPNLETNLVTSQGLGLYDNLEDTLRAVEAPPRNANHQFWMHGVYQAAKERGVRVLLSGYAGNMSISYGWKTLLPKLFLSRRWNTLASELRAMNAGHLSISVFYNEVLNPILNELRWFRIWSQTKRMPFRNYSPISQDFADQHEVAMGLVAYGAEYNRSYIYHRRLREQIITGDASHEKGQTNAGYRALYGIEQRDPTPDRRIVEFCLGIPETQFFNKGVDRWLIRRVMSDRLPASVIENRLRGQQGPDHAARFKREAEIIAKDLARFESDEFLSQALDLPRLKNAVNLCLSNPEADVPEFGWPLPLAVTAGRFAQTVSEDSRH